MGILLFIVVPFVYSATKSIKGPGATFARYSSGIAIAAFVYFYGFNNMFTLTAGLPSPGQLVFANPQIIKGLWVVLGISGVYSMFSLIAKSKTVSNFPEGTRYTLSESDTQLIVTDNLMSGKNRSFGGVAGHVFFVVGALMIECYSSSAGVFMWPTVAMFVGDMVNNSGPSAALGAYTFYTFDRSDNKVTRGGVKLAALSDITGFSKTISTRSSLIGTYIIIGYVGKKACIFLTSKDSAEIENLHAKITGFLGLPPSYIESPRTKRSTVQNNISSPLN